MPPRIRKCALCGKEFEAPNGFVKRCPGPHFATCEVCGKEFSIDCEPNQIPKTCSEECRRIAIVRKRDKTVKERYGVDNVSHLDSVKKKLSEASSEGGKGLAKRREACIEKYGVDHISKIPEVRDKLSKVMTSDSYKEKVKQTSLERYGVDNYWKQEEVVEQRRLQYIQKYGSVGKPWDNLQYEKMMIDPSKRDDYLKFKENPEGWITNKYDNLPNIRQLCSDLGVTDTPIYDILIKHDCSALLRKSASSIMEEDVINLICEQRPDLHIIKHDRSVIAPLELDIYIPELQLAIECNPTTTHNSSFADPWGSPPKSPSYHSHKSEMCRKNGIFLFHIFGYEWTWNREIIESMIKNLIQASTKKIYGRNTEVRELSFKDCSDFLNENHRQGNTNASVRLGLFYYGELVSVMTFGKVRSTMGDKSFEWELSRFCSKLNTNVIGGASKLFKHFVKNYSPQSIISFSDVSHTRGKLYRTLGFNPASKIQSNYIWVNLKTDRCIHRVNCQKRNLLRLFVDVTRDDIENNTEREIMESHGYARVFESGTLRWEWNR